MVLLVIGLCWDWKPRGTTSASGWGGICAASSHCSEHLTPQFVSEPCEDFPALAVTSADLRAVGIQGVFFFLVVLQPDKSTCYGRDGLGRAVSGCVVMLKARLCQPLHQSWQGRD